MKIQKSSSFLLPILNLSFPELKGNGFISSYVGDASWTEEVGSHLLILLDTNEISPSYMEKLRAHSLYVRDYTVDTGIMFVFDVSEWREGVVLPFLDGKYSKIEREFVKKYFPEKVYSAGQLTPSINYKILTKHDDLRYYWESILDMSLPEDAEVWSKPDLEEEIFDNESMEQTSE